MLSDSVYEDLPEFDLGANFKQIEDENAQLKERLHELEAELTRVQSHLAKAQEIQSNLERNLSELFKTSKAEIERKDRVIADLRKQLDNVLFRRAANNNVHPKTLQNSELPNKKRERDLSENYRIPMLENSSKRHKHDRDYKERSSSRGSYDHYDRKYEGHHDYKKSKDKAHIREKPRGRESASSAPYRDANGDNKSVCILENVVLVKAKTADATKNNQAVKINQHDSAVNNKPNKQPELFAPDEKKIEYRSHNNHINSVNKKISNGVEDKTSKKVETPTEKKSSQPKAHNDDEIKKAPKERKKSKTPSKCRFKSQTKEMGVAASPSLKEVKRNDGTIEVLTQAQVHNENRTVQEVQENEPVVRQLKFQVKVPLEHFKNNNFIQSNQNVESNKDEEDLTTNSEEIEDKQVKDDNKLEAAIVLEKCDEPQDVESPSDKESPSENGEQIEAEAKQDVEENTRENGSESMVEKETDIHISPKHNVEDKQLADESVDANKKIVKKWRKKPTKKNQTEFTPTKHDVSLTNDVVSPLKDEISSQKAYEIVEHKTPVKVTTPEKRIQLTPDIQYIVEPDNTIRYRFEKEVRVTLCDVMSPAKLSEIPYKVVTNAAKPENKKTKAKTPSKAKPKFTEHVTAESETNLLSDEVEEITPKKAKKRTSSDGSKPRKRSSGKKTEAIECEVAAANDEKTDELNDSESQVENIVPIMTSTPMPVVSNDANVSTADNAPEESEVRATKKRRRCTLKILD